MSETYLSFIVDAFTNTQFGGNPASICLIPKSLSTSAYQKIAAELNCPANAFPVPTDPSLDYKTASNFSLRWFTPANEVPLCGHATLATSHVLFNEIGNVNKELKFETKSGVLTVNKDEKGNVEMDFPKYDLQSIKFKKMENSLGEKFAEIDAPDFLLKLIKCVVPETRIQGALLAPKIGFVLVIVDPKTTIAEFEALKLDVSTALQLFDRNFFRGLILIQPTNPMDRGFVDSQGKPYDYACRHFMPWDGVVEDPATGSAQCAIGPFLETMTGKKEFYGYQAFPGRGAQFRLKLLEDRVMLIGSAVSVVRGEIAYY